MNENRIEVFSSAEFGAVRTLKTDDGKVLFCGADVAKALGYARPSEAVSKHCKGTSKQRILTNGGMQEMLFIPEGDIYRLITHSKLPNAEKFEAWVFDEVLPTIRRHGAYMTDDTLEKALTSPDFLIQLATNLKEEQEKRKALEIKVEEDKPKVIFADAVATSRTSILVGDLAKLLKQNGVKIGANRLFEWLRQNGYLISRKGTDWNMPTQKSMEMGLFEVKETAVTHLDGHSTINRTPKVTGRGQQYFVNKILKGWIL
ncbi:MAG: phage antirepressor KilAC domain-containing protein [Ruminococcus flavefaciens]|nr:phage antirepressor KilAC domain-containing protein [Ruminococcus flavefaciens]